MSKLEALISEKSLSKILTYMELDKELMKTLFDDEIGEAEKVNVIKAKSKEDFISVCLDSYSNEFASPLINKILSENQFSKDDLDKVNYSDFVEISRAKIEIDKRNKELALEVMMNERVFTKNLTVMPNKNVSGDNFSKKEDAVLKRTAKMTPNVAFKVYESSFGTIKNKNTVLERRADLVKNARYYNVQDLSKRDF